MDIPPIPLLDQIFPDFNQLSAEEILFVRENITTKHFSPDEVVYAEGETPRFMSILVEGQVKILKTGESGKQQIVQIISPFTTFGYRAYYAGQKYSTSAIAVEKSVMYQIPLEAAQQILLSNAKMAYATVKLLSKDLGFAQDRALNLTQKHVRGRLADAILMVYDHRPISQQGTNIINGRLARKDYANISNMTTENCIRTFSDFVKEGVISIEGRTITVLDEVKLRSISKFG